MNIRNRKRACICRLFFYGTAHEQKTAGRPQLWLVFLSSIAYNEYIRNNAGQVKRMRMEQLKYLVDVAETKSMTKTAERLFVTPQAVSKNIKQLEMELDTTLLVRTSAGVEFTHLGASVVALARDMLDKELQMRQMITADKHRTQQQQSFSIRICSTSAIANMLLPGIIAKFMKMGIHIVPRIYMVDSLQELLDHTEQGLCDLALVSYNEEALFNRFAPYQYSLDMDLLAQDELIVVMNADTAAQKDMLSIQDFLGHMCTMFSMMPVENMAQMALNTHVMRSNDADFHRAMLKEADAYVLMPRCAYEHFFNYAGYRAMTLERSKPSILHAAIYRKDASEYLRTFAQFVRVGMQNRMKYTE